MNESRLSELRQRVEAVLRTKKYKEACIKRYNHTWDHVQGFMDTGGIIFYERKVGDTFLSEWHSHKPYEQLTHRQKERVRHVDVLSGFQERNVLPPSHYKYREILFEGELGKPFNAFIEEEQIIKKGSSITRYKERIEHLYRHLQKESRVVKELDTPCMLRFINHLGTEKKPVDRNNIIMTIRLFMRYLCSCELLSNNNSAQWMSLLKLRQVHQPKIPSVYSREEVEALIGAIDRGNPQGKRDYAMILLAARYGLRISDIIGMRHCNLDWEHNQIVIFQQKTGKKVILPLSEEVGNAIIDYLKYSRPKIELPYIFITAHAPYKELTSNGMGITIKDYFRMAGVSFTNKRHGPHSLRHSLASNLLKSNESLPVISEILGHSSTETTMEYLRIDMNLLQQCALDVPFVPSSFYDNLYGN
jgi:site-specific recombinase XerD